MAIVRGRSKSMKRIFVTAVLLYAVCAVFSMCDELDSQLAKELLREKLYHASLSARGDSGFVITSGTDTLYQGAWLVGLNGFLDRSGENSPFNEVGFNLCASAGVWEKPFGIFNDLEISLNVPYFMNEVSLDSESGMGDPRISVKTNVLQGRPMTDMPDISLIISALLPGDEEGGYTQLDQGGAEAGIIFGARMPDSSGTSEFRLFVDVRFAVYDYLTVAEDSAQDQFIISRFGISFPVLDIDNCFLLLEMGKTVQNAHLMNGNDYSVAIRYKNTAYNWTAGVVMKDYEEEGISSSRRLYLMYDHKF
jgi:hypothetical protein